MPQVDLNHPTVIVTVLVLLIIGLKTIFDFVKEIMVWKRGNGRRELGYNVMCPYGGTIKPEDWDKHADDMHSFMTAIQTEIHQSNAIRKEEMETKRILADALRDLRLEIALRRKNGGLT